MISDNEIIIINYNSRRRRFIRLVEAPPYFSHLQEMANSLIQQISSNAPPAITNRDFLHLRIQKVVDDNGTKIILDKSVTHPAKPNLKGCILFHTSSFVVQDRRLTTPPS